MAQEDYEYEYEEEAELAGHYLYHVNKRKLIALEDAITIGSKKGDLIFPDDSKMAPSHCRIRSMGKKIIIEDLKSGGITRLDGKKILSGGKKQLVHGGLIKIGKQQFIFSKTKNLVDIKKFLSKTKARKKKSPLIWSNYPKGHKIYLLLMGLPLAAYCLLTIWDALFMGRGFESELGKTWELLATVLLIGLISVFTLIWEIKSEFKLRRRGNYTLLNLMKLRITPLLMAPIIYFGVSIGTSFLTSMSDYYDLRDPLMSSIKNRNWNRARSQILVLKRFVKKNYPKKKKLNKDIIILQYQIQNQMGFNELKQNNPNLKGAEYDHKVGLLLPKKE